MSNGIVIDFERILLPNAMNAHRIVLEGVFNDFGRVILDTPGQQPSILKTFNHTIFNNKYSKSTNNTNSALKLMALDLRIIHGQDTIFFDP